MKKWLIAIISIIVVSICIMFGVKYIKSRPIKEEDLKKIYPITYSDTIISKSKKYSLDPYLVFSLIKAESSYNKDAESTQDAKGLMQITPTTAEWIAEKMGNEEYKEEYLFDVDVNVEMGCWYLDNLRTEFGEHKEVILAAYNAGRGNVQKWLHDGRYSDDGDTLKEIPFSETKAYVEKIAEYEKMYTQLYKEQFEAKDVEKVE